MVLKLRELGRTGEKLPVIGVGTWKLGSEPQKEIESIRYAISSGAGFVDTAEMYGTEELVGEAIKGSKVFVATKVSPHNFHKEDVIKSCNASLKRLGIKQIDLYQLHWPNKSVPIAETMAAMEQLVKDGKVRYIGVSNFDVKELEEAQAALKSNDIVSNQIEYSILVRTPENGLANYMKGNHITLIAYSPLARGAIFTKKYAPVEALLSEIATKHGISASQVALAWLVSKPNVVAIPKASSYSHTKQNIESGSIELTEEDLKKIDSFLPNGL